MDDDEKGDTTYPPRLNHAFQNHVEQWHRGIFGSTNVPATGSNNSRKNDYDEPIVVVMGWRRVMKRAKSKVVALVLLAATTIYLVVSSTNAIAGTVHSPPVPFSSSVHQRDDSLQQRFSACLDLLGQNGKWTQDWNYSRDYGQYAQPVVYPESPYVSALARRFQPQQDAPFPWRTSWKWIDDADTVLKSAEIQGTNILPSCQIDYTLSGGKLCKILKALNVSTVLMNGDSLQRLMWKSFVNIVGRPFLQHYSFDNEALREAKVGKSSFQGTIVCPENQTVDLLFHRTSGGGQAFPTSPRAPLVFPNYTRQFISTSPGRVVMVFNIGAHYHNITHFEEDFDVWVNFVRSLRRPNDLVFFRTTVPGHPRCVPRRPKQFDWRNGKRIKPLESYQQFSELFLRNGPLPFANWGQFEAYNSYAKKQTLRLSRTGRSSSSPSGPRIRVLDVFNMTVLRNDAYAGGVDCLHHMNPGPVDWWTHLFYTHLKLLALNKEGLGETTTTE
mmetsp:Transcript_11036/g.30498  ORF Transcript_11036/g.30498 Transcript_11036/m.30498 type:complete len:499 (-) Transcript_11036:76-1572(-)